jgi:hypothetical protein
MAYQTVLVTPLANLPATLRAVLADEDFRACISARTRRSCLRRIAPMRVSAYYADFRTPDLPGTPSWCSKPLAPSNDVLIS